MARDGAGIETVGVEISRCETTLDGELGITWGQHHKHLGEGRAGRHCGHRQWYGCSLTFDARVEDHCSCPSRRKWNWVFWVPKWLRWTTGSGAATVDVQAPVQAPDSSRELALALKRLALRQEIDDWALTKNASTAI